MLEINKHLRTEEAAQGGWGPSGAEPRNFFMNIIRRQLSIFVLIMTLTMALGIFYVFNAVPIYIATASMVIDARKSQLYEHQSPGPDVVVDAGMVQTQIETLKSANVSRAVIKELRLTEDPEFIGSGPSFVQSMLNLVTSLYKSAPPPPPSESLVMRQVLAAFEGRRTVTRVGQSYVMEISVQSTDPEKAARIANAIAEAYIDDQLEAKYEATRRASVWLQDRLKELRAQASVQQRAVVDFREKNNIIDAGGRLMNDQQISEVNSQLILAQAATAEAKARYDRIRQIMKQDVPDASITDALKNEIIVKLRGQYLEMAARVAIWSQKYGATHLSVINQQTQMREVLHSIKDEMRKIEESYKSEYEIAQAREQSISNSLGNAVSQSQITNQAQIQLRELESGAQTSRSLYDNFLQRYIDAVQQESFPITEARLISLADTPLTKSFPKTPLVLLLTTAIGLVASFGVASLREIWDRVFRSSEQVEEALNTNCLAMLPRLNAPPALSEERRAAEVSASASSEIGLMQLQPMLNHVLDEPFSQFTEGLRAVKVATDFKGVLKSHKVIGLTSTLPHEGKSTVAANYAQLIAHGGAHAILIDADLRNPTLSRQLGLDGPGLVDVVGGRRSIDDVLMHDPRSGLSLLSSGAHSKMLHTNELLASDAMRHLIETLRQSYDYVVVDLPPLIPVIDARAATNFIDSYLFVVEWGRTRIDAAKHGLSNAPEVYERLLGVVINKVDMSAIRRYERYRSDYFYDKYSAQYGGSESSSHSSRSKRARSAL